MKVLLLPADMSGCAYYRMTEPVRALQEAGVDIEFEVSYDLDVDGEYTPGGETRLFSVDPHGADVVVFQRPSNMAFPQAIELLKASGVAVVVEIDDLMDGVSVGHAGHRELVGEGVGRRILDCARQADMITVSTPALLRAYATHGPGRVIPNTIPRRIAELAPAYTRDPETVSIGWTGSVYTHPHDLQQIGTGLRTALDRANGRARFSVLGQSHGAQERLGLAAPPHEIPWTTSVDGYLQSIGDNLDIGLAPLRDDKFNACKSALKVLEYSARGLYTVRSTTPEYESLGLGWRAKSPKDWAKGITVAVDDPDRRRERAEAARRSVLDHHLTEHTAERWLRAWTDAADTAARSRGHVTC